MQFSPSDPELPSPAGTRGARASHVRAGADVRARGTRWHIVDIRSYGACRVVTLSGLTPPHVGVERRILEPFDAIDPLDLPRAPQVVSARRWRAVCRSLIASAAPPGSLRQGHSARIDLMPHQLEPALAVVGGAGTRVLLADEVGLGKTIQAGLMLAELRARAWIDRVLVLTPAGLRDQWRRELSERFDIDGTVVDGRVLRHVAATIPLGMNPWATLTVAIVSTDYVKRAEVLPAVAACRWDAVVIDEAHGVAGGSDRHDAAELLASRASYVLLLTATPHNGDRSAFDSLCTLGSAGGDSLLVFRRRRSDVRVESRRRIHTLRVRLSAPERQMHAALGRYCEAVRAEHGDERSLALSVLHKRAFSGAWSLARSIDRRLEALADTTASAGAEQMALPLGDPDGDLTAADEPPDWPIDLALSDRSQDRRLLAGLLETCRAAAATERKIAALRRLLRRAREPAIVFTEYRDTLLHVQRALAAMPNVALHGGMGREDRIAALAEFERGPRTILLATDAAGEGLNLQRACRLVVNLELPWNPMRLEQRIGRVDRIGQTRTVHAFHLVADPSGETRIRDRLKARVACAQADIGAANPLGDLQEAVDDGWEAPGTAPDGERVVPDLRNEALAEAERLHHVRLCSAAGERSVGPADQGRGVRIVRASHTGLRPLLGPRTLLVWRVTWENRAGQAVEARLVAATVDGVPRLHSLADIKRTVLDLGDRLSPTIETASSEWRRASASAIERFVSTRLARERAILAKVAARPDSRYQPGLFDRRAEQQQELARHGTLESEREVLDRIAHIERAADISPGPPALLLALVP